MNTFSRFPEIDAMHTMRNELVEWSTAPRVQYANLAGKYVAGLEATVNTVASEAQFVGTRRLGQPGSYEMVTWRIDGKIGDGSFDYATRVSMLVDPDDGRTPPKESLVSEAVVPRVVSPKVREHLGTKGLHIAGIEYKKVPLTEVPGPMPIVRAQLTKISRMRADGFAAQVFSADHKAVDEVVPFPRLPDFETLETLGYAAFCLSKVDRAPITEILADKFAAAAERDATASYKPDNLTLYAELTAGVPRGVEQRIRQLGDALYKYKPGTELPPELIAAMMDPDIAVIAELAQLNKTKYVRKIEGTRDYTPALHNQLAVVAENAMSFQGELYPLMLADKKGYDTAMNAQLQKAETAVMQAEAFRDHLTVPETIALDPKDWAVRGSL